MCTNGTRWHIYQIHSKHIFYNKFKRFIFYNKFNLLYFIISLLKNILPPKEKAIIKNAV